MDDIEEEKCSNKEQAGMRGGGRYPAKDEQLPHPFYSIELRVIILAL